MTVSWPIRSVLAGTAGTATMTLAYAAERRVRRARGPLDYDDSLVPGQKVMATSVGTHVAYVAAVAAVDDGLRRARLAS